MQTPLGVISSGQRHHSFARLMKKIKERIFLPLKMGAIYANTSRCYKHLSSKNNTANQIYIYINTL